MSVAPCLGAAILLVASRLIHGRSPIRLDLGAHATSQLSIALLLISGLTLLATVVALGRGARGLGRSATSLLLIALLVTPIYAMLSFASISEVSESTAASASMSPWGERCLAIAATMGLLVLTSFTAALRRAAPAASRVRGAALGAAAGAWAGLVVFLFCPAFEPEHLLVGHVLPIPVFTLLGLAFAPRALRP